MLENGNTREDLCLPSQTDDDIKLAEQIRNDFEEGKEIIVSVLAVCFESYINKLTLLISRIQSNHCLHPFDLNL